MVAGIFLLAVSLMAMLPLPDVKPSSTAMPSADYANFTAQYAYNSQDIGVFGNIPIVSNIAGFLSSTGTFLGNIANLLNPSSFIIGLGFPPLVASLIIALAALLIGFGMIYLWKGTL